MGLVGPNGVGKSTLVRLLAGRARPDAGSVSVGDCDHVSYLEQQPPDPDLTLGEHLRRSAGEVYAVDREMRALESAMSTGDDAAVAAYGALQHRYEVLDGWRFRDTIDQVRRHIGITGLSDNARFRELSGGQAARVMLAGVLLSRPTVLLLDEPTNHLDLDGIRWLERYLSNFPGAVLVVTHDRRFLDETVSRVLELDPVTRALAVYEGGYTAFRAEKQRLFERRQEEHRAQERYRKRLESDILRTRGQAAADWIERPEQAAAFSFTLAGASQPGRRLAALEDVTAGYDGVAVLSGLDLVVKGRDRIALTGRNGSGKSTLFRVIAGDLEPLSGSALRQARVGVLPRTHDHLPLGRTVLDHYRRGVPGHEHEARAVLGWFLFSQEQLFRPMARLSAGERSRLLIAMLVMGGAELLLLDEPTNHLDFDSIDVVERALKGFRGTILTVSHDREFIHSIGCDRVWEVRDGGVREGGLDLA